MRNLITKLTVVSLSIYYYVSQNNVHAYQQNKTPHHIRRPTYDVFHKPQNLGTYRSFQPVSPHKPTYIKADDRNDYDVNTYDSESGVVVSNFTSSIYDDHPPLYPNPDELSRGSSNKVTENKMSETDVDLPDDSLADADLKEHNISVTYVNGFYNCLGVRDEYMVFVYAMIGFAVVSQLASIMWLMWSECASEFRRNSKFYLININLFCCLVACILIYIQAAVGTPSPAQCEMIAVLLHNTQIDSTVWFVALAIAVAEFCASDT